MKKTVTKTVAEREFAKFSQAVDKLDAHLDESDFVQILIRLVDANMRHPSGAGNRGTIIPVRCDECYLRTEFVLEALGWTELWPTEALNCRHQPVASCPHLQTALARALAGAQ